MIFDGVSQTGAFARSMYGSGFKLKSIGVKLIVCIRRFLSNIAVHFTIVNEYIAGISLSYFLPVTDA